jgi:hypothetical protein
MFTNSQKRDYEFFEKHLHEYLQDPLKAGKYAVIHNEKLVGLFDDTTNAAKFAFSEYEPGEFIVQEIIDYSDRVNYLHLGRAVGV